MRRVVAALLIVLGGLFVRPVGSAFAQTPSTQASSTATSVASVPVRATSPEVGDPESTRRINQLITTLLGLAVVFAVITAWFWRSTKPVAPHLAGLAMMGSRRFRRSPVLDKAGRLELLRQDRGAAPEPEIIGPVAEPVAEPVVEVAATVEPAAPEPTLVPDDTVFDLVHVSDDQPEAPDMDSVAVHE